MALSGGMAQRLMVARAIMHRPQILFLDEPTAGLDPQSRIALWEIVDELHAGGRDDPPHDALHGGGRPALRPRGDHGPRPDPRPRHARAAEGSRPARRRSSRSPPTPPTPTASAATSSTPSTRPPTTRLVDGAVLLSASGHRAAAAHPRPPPSRSASPSPTSRSATRRSRPCSSTSPGRTCANDHHRRPPHRRAAPAAWSSCDRPASPTARRSSPCCSATSTCCSRASPLFIVRAVMQPLLLMFVFTYVFPKIGQGVGGGRRRGGVHRHARGRRRRAGHRVPGHPGRRPAAGAGVRLLQGDRGPRPGAAADEGGRHPEDRHRRAATRCSPPSLVFPIAYVVPATTGRTSHIHWLIAAHAGPARRLGGRRPRARARHEGRAAAGLVPVRPRRAAADVPRLHLLPVAGARGGALAAGRRADQPARLHVRGVPRRPDRRARRT